MAKVETKLSKEVIPEEKERVHASIKREVIVRPPTRDKTMITPLNSQPHSPGIVLQPKLIRNSSIRKYSQQHELSPKLNQQASQSTVIKVQRRSIGINPQQLQAQKPMRRTTVSGAHTQNADRTGHIGRLAIGKELSLPQQKGSDYVMFNTQDQGLKVSQSHINAAGSSFDSPMNAKQMDLLTPKSRRGGFLTGLSIVVSNNPDEMRQNFCLHPQLTQQVPTSFKNSSEYYTRSGKPQSKSSFHLETPIEEEDVSESQFIALSPDNTSTVMAAEKVTNFSKYSGVSNAPINMNYQQSLKVERSRTTLKSKGRRYTQGNQLIKYAQDAKNMEHYQPSSSTQNNQFPISDCSEDFKVSNRESGMPGSIHQTNHSFALVSGIASQGHGMLGAFNTITGKGMPSVTMQSQKFIRVQSYNMNEGESEAASGPPSAAISKATAEASKRRRHSKLKPSPLQSVSGGHRRSHLQPNGTKYTGLKFFPDTLPFQKLAQIASKAKNIESTGNIQQMKIDSYKEKIQLCKKKIKKLEHSLTNTKIFLNMVIHDMRNPTTSIEYALKEILKIINSENSQVTSQLAASQIAASQYAALSQLQLQLAPSNTKLRSNHTMQNIFTIDKQAQSQLYIGQSMLIAPSVNFNGGGKTQASINPNFIPQNVVHSQNAPSDSYSQSGMMLQQLAHTQSLPRKAFKLDEVKERVHQENDDDEEVKVAVAISQQRQSSQNSSPRLNLGDMSNFQQVDMHSNIMRRRSTQRSNNTNNVAQTNLRQSRQNSQYQQTGQIPRMPNISELANFEQTFETAGNVKDDTFLDFPPERSLTSERKHVVLATETKVRFGDTAGDDNYDIYMSNENNFKKSERKIVKRRFLEDRGGPYYLSELPDPKKVDTQQIISGGFSVQQQAKPSNPLSMEHYNNLNSNQDMVKASSTPQFQISKVNSKLRHLIPQHQNAPVMSLISSNGDRDPSLEGASASPSFKNRFSKNEQREDKSIEVNVKQRADRHPGVSQFSKGEERKIEAEKKMIIQISHAISEEPKVAEGTVVKESGDSTIKIDGANQDYFLKSDNRFQSPFFERSLNQQVIQSTQNGELGQNNVQSTVNMHGSSPSSDQEPARPNGLSRLGSVSSQQNQRPLTQSTLNRLQNNLPLQSAFSQTHLNKNLNPSNFMMSPSHYNHRLVQSGLHNPLSIFMNCLILQEDEKKQCEQWLKNSLFSSTMLLNLINDLLDLAKIENSQFNFHTTLFNLHDIIQKAVDTLDFQASQKCIKMEYALDEDNAGYLMEISGDDNRYLQILLNFLSNALKFTPASGSVRIEVALLDFQATNVKDNKVSNQEVNKHPKDSVTPRHGATTGANKKESGLNPRIVNTSGKSMLQEKKIGSAKNVSARFTKECIHNSQDDIIVKDLNQIVESSMNASKRAKEGYVKFQIKIIDTGQGISKENLSKLFMNFSKLEEHAAGNKRGTGLGLSICKNLIEMMGGNVTVESELGKGTTFIMQLQTKCNLQNQKQVNTWLRKFKKISTPEQTSQKPHGTQYMVPNAYSGFDFARMNEIHAGAVGKLNQTTFNVDLAFDQQMGPQLADSKTHMGLVSAQFPPALIQSMVSQGNGLSTPNSKNYLQVPMGRPSFAAPSVANSRAIQRKSVSSQQSQEGGGSGNQNQQHPGQPVMKNAHITFQGSTNTVLQSSLQAALSQNNIMMQQQNQQYQMMQAHLFGQGNAGFNFKASNGPMLGTMHHESGSGMFAIQEEVKIESSSHDFKHQLGPSAQESGSQGRNLINEVNTKLRHVSTNLNPRDMRGRLSVFAAPPDRLRSDLMNVFEQHMLQLREKHSKLFNRAGGANKNSDLQSSATQQHAPRFKALIANDDPFQLGIVSGIFKQCGFEVDEAENGLEAVQKHTDNAKKKKTISQQTPSPAFRKDSNSKSAQLQAKQYDVIVLDLDMPIMNGYEACQRLRQGEKKADLQEIFQIKKRSIAEEVMTIAEAPSSNPIGASGPAAQGASEESKTHQKLFIVALSGLITEAVKDRGLKCGFDDFIETPITESKIKEQILSVLHFQVFKAPSHTNSEISSSSSSSSSQTSSSSDSEESENEQSESGSSHSGGDDDIKEQVEEENREDESRQDFALYGEVQPVGKMASGAGARGSAQQNFPYYQNRESSLNRYHTPTGAAMAQHHSLMPNGCKIPTIQEVPGGTQSSNTQNPSQQMQNSGQNDDFSNMVVQHSRRNPQQPHVLNVSVTGMQLNSMMDSTKYVPYQNKGNNSNTVYERSTFNMKE